MKTAENLIIYGDLYLREKTSDSFIGCVKTGTNTSTTSVTACSSMWEDHIATLSSVTLTPGRWVILGYAWLQDGASTGSFGLGIGSSNSTTSLGRIADNRGAIDTSGNFVCSVMSANRDYALSQQVSYCVDISTNKTFYLKACSHGTRAIVSRNFMAFRVA